MNSQGCQSGAFESVDQGSSCRGQKVSVGIKTRALYVLDEDIGDKDSSTAGRQAFDSLLKLLRGLKNESASLFFLHGYGKDPIGSSIYGFLRR